MEDKIKRNNEGLKKIIQYLTKKYKPLSILMTGSRVYGKPQFDSDWDILVITEKRKDRIKEPWQGYNLDVTVVHKNYFKRNFALDWASPISKSIIIKDSDSIGRNLIDFMKQKLKKPGNIK